MIDSKANAFENFWGYWILLSGRVRDSSYILQKSVFISFVHHLKPLIYITLCKVSQSEKLSLPLPLFLDFWHMAEPLSQQRSRIRPRLLRGNMAPRSLSFSRHRVEVAERMELERVEDMSSI